MADQAPRAINLAPNQARQLLNQYAVEKKAAEAAGLDTPVGQSHMHKAEKIRNILYTYSKKQKQAQQGQGQGQGTPGSQTAAGGAGSGAQTSGGALDALPAQLKKQEILSKYQQVMQMAEKFKSSLAIIQQRRAEPDLDAKTVAYYAEKEKEMVMRIENCKKVTQQIASQLKGASGGAQTAAGGPNSANGSSPQMGSAGSPMGSAGRMGVAQGGPQVGAQNGSRGAGPTLGGVAGPASFTRSNTGPVPDDRSRFDNMSIPDSLRVSGDTPSSRVNSRASLMGGAALYAPALTAPAMAKGQTFNYDGEQVLNKRKLRELVASVAAEKGDVDVSIDGDVEELLLDLADEFVHSLTGFAARLARHRHSDNLDVRDVQLPLERAWNVRVPGYALDEIRTVKKFTPNQAHAAKVNGVNITRSVNRGA